MLEQTVLTLSHQSVWRAEAASRGAGGNHWSVDFVRVSFWRQMPWRAIQQPMYIRMCIYICRRCVCLCDWVSPRTLPSLRNKNSLVRNPLPYNVQASYVFNIQWDGGRRPTLGWSQPSSQSPPRPGCHPCTKLATIHPHTCTHNISSPQCLIRDGNHSTPSSIDFLFAQLIFGERFQPWKYIYNKCSCIITTVL
jgi:hypothetical protein